MKNHLVLRKRSDVLAWSVSATMASPATPSAAYAMINMDEAQKIVLANTEALPLVTVELQDALGLVLGEHAVAKDNLPPFPASIKVRNAEFLDPLAQNLSIVFSHSPSAQSRSPDINLVHSFFV